MIKKYRFQINYPDVTRSYKVLDILYSIYITCPSKDYCYYFFQLMSNLTSRFCSVFFNKRSSNYFIILMMNKNHNGKDKYPQPLTMNFLIQPIHSIKITRGKLYRTRAYPKNSTKQLQNPELRLLASPDCFQKIEKNQILQVKQKKQKHYRRHSQTLSRDVKSNLSMRMAPSIPASHQTFRDFAQGRPKSMIIQIHGSENKVLKKRLSDIFSFSNSDSQYFNRNRFSDRKVSFGRFFSSQNKDRQKVKLLKSQLFRLPK